MSVDKALLSGSTAMLILSILENEDMYGYQMIETLREKSNNIFDFKAGTLYPLLHSLEEKGFLTSYEVLSSGKVRKYYSITKNGRKQLLCKKQEWNEYSYAVKNIIGGECCVQN